MNGGLWQRPTQTELLIGKLREAGGRERRLNFLKSCILESLSTALG